MFALKEFTRTLAGVVLKNHGDPFPVKTTPYTVLRNKTDLEQYFAQMARHFISEGTQVRGRGRGKRMTVSRETLEEVISRMEDAANGRQGGSGMQRKQTRILQELGITTDELLDAFDQTTDQ